MYMFYSLFWCLALGDVLLPCLQSAKSEAAWCIDYSVETRPDWEIDNSWWVMTFRRRYRIPTDSCLADNHGQSWEHIYTIQSTALPTTPSSRLMYIYLIKPVSMSVRPQRLFQYERNFLRRLMSMSDHHPRRYVVWPDPRSRSRKSEMYKNGQFQCLYFLPICM